VLPSPHFLVFETTVSAEALAASLERSGFRAEILLPHANGQLSGDTSFVRAYWHDRSLSWHAEGLNLLLYELAKPDTL
jgi:hypothetical protein